MIGRNDLWYKDAVVYCLDVETFQDGNGDGIGDFQGLTRRLDYLANLGVNCLWLLPFYPSPNRDNGYDVMDYYAVDERLGTLGDFVDFVRSARERGLRVIADLVVNHTSVEHPWFQKARQNPDSPYRDFYVWSETLPEDADEGMLFPGQQESVWTWDEQAGAYYLHRFYEHQPDLNITSPAVREEIRKIMGFWLELGISGFRVDAAPYLIELKGIDPSKADVEDPHVYLERMREFLQWRQGDAVLIAEANVAPDKTPEYFGEGDRMHMLFQFYANQHLFLALARRDAATLAEGLRGAPAIPRVCQWAHFLRNHDELNLDQLTDAEREEVFQEMAPDPDMRVFERGIRRRLPPMLGDERRLRMAYSLLFSLPGTPVLRYGQEIGMGDNLSLKGRFAVRTPMQWSAEPNAGFSTAPADRLARPVIDQGPYSYQKVNVQEQRHTLDSMLSWVQHLIRVRRECPEWGWGDWEILDAGDPAVFAHRAEWQGGTVLAVHNLADDPRTATLDLGSYQGRQLVSLLDRRDAEPVGGERHQIELGPFDYHWFRIDGQPALAHHESVP